MMHKQGGCGCGKPKPCPDGGCPHKRRLIPTLLTPFSVWVTKYTPVIPKFYWDVESQEERIKHICLELDRLRAYINYMFCELEKLANNLAEALEQAEELASQLAQRLSEAEQLLTELRTLIADVQQRITDLTAEVEAAKQQAQQAQQAAQQANTKADNAQQQAQQANTKADNAQQQAQQANTKADNAQQQAQQAQQAAQQASEQVASAQDDIDNLKDRVAALEECCEHAKARLDELERWRGELEDRIAPLFIDPDNPVVNINGVEMIGQVSSGPIAPQTEARYSSTISFTIPMQGIQGNSINVEELKVVARCGSWLRYVDNGGTEHVFFSPITLIQNNAPAIPEIVGWSIWITPYAGINVRIMFNQSLTKRVWHPDKTYTNEAIINASAVSYEVYIKARVS